MSQAIEVTSVPVPLTQMVRGQRGVLRSAALEGGDGDMLMAMGLRPNCRLRLCRKGETCIVAVETGCGGGCRSGLDKRRAERLLVEPDVKKA